MLFNITFLLHLQLVAQAELVAANEERIQSSRSSGASRAAAATSQQQITSSLLSSALASAGISQASSSRSTEGYPHLNTFFYLMIGFGVLRIIIIDSKLALS